MLEENEFTVERFMSTALVFARPEETVDDMEFSMQIAGIRHLPVIDSDNRVVGIVSQRDIIRAQANGSAPATIRSIMTKQVHTLDRDALAIDAVALLLKNRIGCVPIVGDDRSLIGIVTETDFLWLAHEVLAGRSPEGVGRRPD